MKALLALSLGFAILPCFAGNASASTLTICNNANLTASWVFISPTPPGYVSNNKSLSKGQCIQVPGVADGNYDISLYNGSDCFVTVNVSGNTVYTLDQATRDKCEQDEMDANDRMFGN